MLLKYSQSRRHRTTRLPLQGTRNIFSRHLGPRRRTRASFSVVPLFNRSQRSLWSFDRVAFRPTVTMQLQQQKYQGLVSDLLPNIRWMQGCGHFLFKFTSGPILIRKIYSFTHFTLCFLQFIFIIVNMVQNMAEGNELTANTVTTLFFTHSLVKLTFFALTSDSFYMTLNIWNQANAHPLFAESDARYRALTLAKMRKLLVFVICFTVFAVTAWTTITFFGESVKFVNDPMTNSSVTVEIPRLPIKSFYPWDSFKKPQYYISFAYQVYYLLFSLLQANLTDLLFCSWLLFACEQLQHLKGIMKPLMELSSTLDTYRPNSAALFRSISAGSTKELIDNEGTEHGLISSVSEGNRNIALQFYPQRRTRTWILTECSAARRTGAPSTGHPLRCRISALIPTT